VPQKPRSVKHASTAIFPQLKPPDAAIVPPVSMLSYFLAASTLFEPAKIRLGGQELLYWIYSPENWRVELSFGKTRWDLQRAAAIILYVASGAFLATLFGTGNLSSIFLSAKAILWWCFYLLQSFCRRVMLSFESLWGPSSAS